MQVHIKQGRLFDPASQLDGQQDLFISDGRIASISTAPDGFVSDLEINAADKLVLPGLVDLCARFREPGFEHKATFQTESLAAVRGGVTAICCPPDTDPVIDSVAVVEFVLQRANETGRFVVYPLAALTQGLQNKQLTEMQLLKEAGCVGVSNALSPMDNAETLRRTFEYASSCDLPVFLYAENSALKNKGVVHEGEISTRLGLPAFSESAEAVAISQALILLEQTAVKLHICRVSSARGISLIRAAQQQGLSVTADVAVCNLHLTDMDVSDYNSHCHLQPPLRNERDRAALLAAIDDGSIAAVCSDHQPHDADAKRAPFSLTEPGASTIEHLLPLMMHLVKREELSLEQAVAVLSSRPAGILGIEKGSLKVGADADICIFDPDVSTNVREKEMFSAGKNTPFYNWELPGAVTHTLLSGKVVFDKSTFS